jgi:hypothetical protein
VVTLDGALYLSGYNGTGSVYGTNLPAVGMDTQLQNNRAYIVRVDKDGVPDLTLTGTYAPDPYTSSVRLFEDLNGRLYGVATSTGGTDQLFGPNNTLLYAWPSSTAGTLVTCLNLNAPYRIVPVNDHVVAGTVVNTSMGLVGVELRDPTDSITTLSMILGPGVSHAVYSLASSF